VYSSNGYPLDESPRRLGELRRTPERERTDRAAMWERLITQGYLYLPGQIPVDLVDAFRAFYFGAMTKVGLTRTGTSPADAIAAETAVDAAKMRSTLFDEIIPSPQYERFCRTPAILDWFRWFADDDVHLHKRKIIRHVLPGEMGIGTATHAHYDLVFLREGSDQVLSFWIPLGDIPLSRGGLIYLEDSHREVQTREASSTPKMGPVAITANLPRLAAEWNSRWLLTDYRAGDMVVHSSHIVHASLDNVDEGGRMRLSTDIRYQRASQPIDWRWLEDWSPQDPQSRLEEQYLAGVEEPSRALGGKITTGAVAPEEGMR
jgi:hypothetical protein